MDKKPEFEIGTWELSAFFGCEHRCMRRLADRYSEYFKSFGELIERRQKKTNGRPVDEFRLNEAQALFMCSLMPNDPRCIEFKKKIIMNIYNHELINITNELKKPAVERFGYVYIIEDNSRGLVKIGASINPKIRTKTICSTHNINNSRLFISQQIKDYTTVEVRTHAHFINHRKYGEWFNVKFNDAIEWLNSYIEKMEVSNGKNSCS